MNAACSIRASLLGALLLLIGLNVSSHAAVATAAAASPTDVQMSDILPPPTTGDLQKMRDEAKALDDAAQVELSAAGEREARYRMKLDARKSDLEATKSRLDLAKKD